MGLDPTEWLSFVYEGINIGQHIDEVEDIDISLKLIHDNLRGVIPHSVSRLH